MRLKTYLLSVTLPALVLVALGVRLVILESARVKSDAIERMNERAQELSTRIKLKLKSSVSKPCEEFRRSEPPPRSPRHFKENLLRQRMGAQDHCRHHDLPAKVLEELAKFTSDSHCVCQTKKFKVAIRHGCGETILHGERKIHGKIFGKAPLKPILPGFYVCVAPWEGDSDVAFDMRAQAAFISILFLLMAAGLAAGVALLARAAKRAHEEARRKTDFLSNISHELKTPLTSISLFSEMLSSGALGEEAKSHAVKTISNESKRLARLIDSLLEYARLERGARNFAIEQFDLKELALEAIEAFKPSFGNGLEVTGAPSAIVQGERDATRRILDCLLENAAKYAAGGGMTTIEISPRALAVKDSGPGIEANDAKKIFERFWRADNSITRSTGGTGLGLAIAQELARGMHATLSYSPNTPKGAVFTLSFAQ